MTTSYPVHVTARLDSPVSRWLWLVKWVLALPHFVALVFLWLAFVVLSVVAFVAIVVTGRYPRSIFDFNVGVLRWHWRVVYYAYSALGTDRYPPFTLQDVPDYPARFDVEYPEHLSRGLVWVKWWLLAIPHYLVVGVLLGGGYVVAEAGERNGSVGLIPVLVLVAAVALLFTGRYPQPLFDLILGLNRWVLRVGAYAALMTDQYPPFRLDQGGGADGPVPTTPARVDPDPGRGRPGVPAGPTGGWTTGRIASVVVGAVLAGIGAALALPGLGVLAADHVGRDSAGFLTTPDAKLSSDTYAITSGELGLHMDAPPALTPDVLVGDVRVTATGGDDTPVFVGIGPTAQVRRYLDGVARATLTGVEDDEVTYRTVPGDAPGSAPADADFWVATSSGTGVQRVTWTPEGGDWMVVVMNADGSRGVDAVASAGAEMPSLVWLVGVLLGLAAACLAAGAVLIAAPLVAVGREQRGRQGWGRGPTPGTG